MTHPTTDPTIEALLARADTFVNQHADYWPGECGLIERLAAALRGMVDGSTNRLLLVERHVRESREMKAHHDEHHEREDRLRAENERLREALSGLLLQTSTLPLGGISRIRANQLGAAESKARTALGEENTDRAARGEGEND